MEPYSHVRLLRGNRGTAYEAAERQKTMSMSFALEFEPLSARNGWMNCWLTVNGDRQHMYASSVFAPFGDVLKFARALATDRLPHAFAWQEEGPWIEFKAFPIQPGSPQFRMVVERNGTQILDAELHRMETVHRLVEELRGVALDCPGAESEWEFPYFLLEDFERELAQGIPEDPPSGHISQARFVFINVAAMGVCRPRRFAFGSTMWYLYRS